MGLTTVIAILAMGIALVALWLVSDVIKKVESQNEKFLRAHLSAIRDEIRNTDRTVVKVEKAVKALIESDVGKDKRINDHTTDIQNARARIAKVAEGLDLLDRAIPQRYRARVVVAKEAEKKTETKAKPTVQ